MTTLSSHEILSETIHFSDQLLRDYMNSIISDSELSTSEIVIISLYRCSIEYLDSLYVLADHGLEGPASTSMRALLEVNLSLSYILYEEDKLEQRAKAYYVGYQKNTIADLEVRLRDFIGTVEEKNKLKNILTIVRNSLKRDEVKDTVKEWQRAKQRNRGHDPKWHALYNGPKSITRLAILMQENDIVLKRVSPQSKFHEQTYSVLSREAHSYAALDKFKSVDVLPTHRHQIQLEPIRTSTESVMEGTYRISNAIGLMAQLNVTFVFSIFPQYKGKLVEFAERFAK